MHRILIIEDEPGLRSLLSRLLATNDYAVTAVGTGTEGLAVALRDTFDLVLLDLMLPDLSGEQIMTALLATRPDTRIVVLSSALEARRRVGVLENGAADFLAKPFVNNELLARVRLRMNDARPVARLRHLDIDSETYLDVSRRELVVRDVRIALSAREYTLLEHLVAHRDATCSRQELLREVWGLDFDPGTNVVDVYIGRLRSKLRPVRIETVRNVGYRLAAS